MGYSRQNIIEKLETAKENMQVFYKADFVNYRGKTSDTNEVYTEIVCEWILENMELLNNVPNIKRAKSYFTKTHDGIIKNKKSNRDEEIIAMRLFNQSQIDNIGEILDYQTPLKNKSSDMAGKIDLLAYDGETLRILELKKPDSDETMLRCVLEGYTYLKTVDVKKLLRDFNLPIDTKIVACPFVFKNGKQYREMKEERPYLHKLMTLLDSKPYYITEENQVYKVEE